MSSTSSSSSPHLPTEVKGHILSFCDQATLAKCSSLSLAFLQLSSPLLYEDVVIQGVENLHKLFCTREDPSFQSHLHPYFALTQIKRLTLFVKDGDVPLDNSESDDPIEINRSRFEPPSFPPLPLRSLTIFLRIQPRMACYKMLEDFLVLFDPTTLHLEGYGPYEEEEIDEEDDTDDLLPLLDCYELGWKRLRHLSLKKAGPTHVIHHLLTHPDASFVVKYDLSTTAPGSSLWKASWRAIRLDLNSIFGYEKQSAAGFVVNGLERVEILVGTTEGKVDLLTRLEDDCDQRFGRAGWEKMRWNLEVVVVRASS